MNADVTTGVPSGGTVVVVLCVDDFVVLVLVSAIGLQSSSTARALQWTWCACLQESYSSSDNHSIERIMMCLCANVCVCFVLLPCATSRDVYPHLCSSTALPSPRRRTRLQDRLLRELCSCPALVAHGQTAVLRRGRVCRPVAAVADKVPAHKALGRHLLATWGEADKNRTSRELSPGRGSVGRDCASQTRTAAD